MRKNKDNLTWIGNMSLIKAQHLLLILFLEVPALQFRHQDDGFQDDKIWLIKLLLIFDKINKINQKYFLKSKPESIVPNGYFRFVQLKQVFLRVEKYYL